MRIRVDVDGALGTDIVITRDVNAFAMQDGLSVYIDAAATELETIAADLRRMYPFPPSREPETTS